MGTGRGIAACLLMTALAAPAYAEDAADLIRRGEAELESGDIPHAVATLQQAVAANPSSSLAHTRLGGALVLAQKYRASIESFKRAIALEEGANANAFVGMAVAYLHTGDYALARAALVEAKRVDGSKAEQIDALIAWIDEHSGLAP
jgi:tetratricopeptide (TPR) repeat protein